MSENVLNSFFNEQSEEDAKARQAAVNQASSESGSLPLKVSGSYLMEVGTYAFPDKKTKEMRTSPELKVSGTKKSLMLLISLRVVDGAPGVPKGSSILTNIVLSPAPGANKETLDNTMRLMKPRIAALTGEKSISVTHDWIEEWLVPTFKQKENGQYEMVKDHKMKKKVMVVVEDDIYMDKPTLSVKAIIKAQPGDKSVPNQIVNEGESQSAAAPSQSEFNGDKSSKSIEDAVENAVNPEGKFEDGTSLPDDF